MRKLLVVMALFLVGCGGSGGTSSSSERMVPVTVTGSSTWPPQRIKE